MELSTLIKERSSIRNFEDKEPTKEQIRAILEAGRLAPSWLNVQPWHFIAVQDKETISLLGKLSFDQQHVLSANTVIVCCGTLDSWDNENYKTIISSRPNITKEKVDFLMNTPAFNPKLMGEEMIILRTVEEVTYAVSYMALEAVNQGLGCCIIGAMGNPLTKSHLDTYDKVAVKLDLPKDAWIITMLVIGYSLEAEKSPKVRKDFSEVVSFNKFGVEYK